MKAEKSGPAPAEAGGKSPGRFLRALLLSSMAAVAALLVWAAVDLSSSRRTDLRRFNPDEVARLDTAMWRSYYDRRRVRLFYQLGELLRTQYGLSFFRANLTALRAARAAFVFKEGHARADYEKALPDLERFYADIRRASMTSFDARRAARLELEWWIVHRERELHAPGDLERALAETAAEVYAVPVERVREHARLRAEAMTLRDTRAAAGGVSEAEWQKIDQLLHASWQSLHRAVNP